jgi:hypothetical protein
MEEGKFLVDREEIYRAKLYKKPAIYMKVYIYLLDKAKFISTDKYKRGTVYLENGLNTIISDFSSKKEKVSYEEIYKVVRYLVRLQVVCKSIASGSMMITITKYNDSQSLKSKNRRQRRITQTEIEKIANQKRFKPT